MNPIDNAKDMLHFFGFTFHEQVAKFLESHTKKREEDNPYSTFRESKSAPFAWREKHSKAEVLKIQSKCDVAMKLWGYNVLGPDDDLQTFNPI